MKIQVSIYDVHSKQKDIRFIYDEERIVKINDAQRALEKEVSQKAFEIVLTEIV